MEIGLLLSGALLVFRVRSKAVPKGLVSLLARPILEQVDV